MCYLYMHSNEVFFTQGSVAVDVQVSSSVGNAATVLTFTYDAALTPALTSLSETTLSVTGKDSHGSGNKIRSKGVRFDFRCNSHVKGADNIFI